MSLRIVFAGIGGAFFLLLLLRTYAVALIDAKATTIMIAKMIKFSSKDFGFGVDVTCGESEENGD